MTLFDFQERINIVNNRVMVKYFVTDDLKIPWWKLWISKKDECDITNDLNKELHEDAQVFAKEHNCPPPFPPLRWVAE